MTEQAFALHVVAYLSSFVGVHSGNTNSKTTWQNLAEPSTKRQKHLINKNNDNNNLFPHTRQFAQEQKL